MDPLRPTTSPPAGRRSSASRGSSPRTTGARHTAAPASSDRPLLRGTRLRPAAPACLRALGTVGARTAPARLNRITVGFSRRPRDVDHRRRLPAGRAGVRIGARRARRRRDRPSLPRFSRPPPIRSVCSSTSPGSPARRRPSAPTSSSRSAPGADLRFGVEVHEWADTGDGVRVVTDRGDAARRPARRLSGCLGPGDAGRPARPGSGSRRQVMYWFDLAAGRTGDGRLTDLHPRDRRRRADLRGSRHRRPRTEASRPRLPQGRRLLPGDDRPTVHAEEAQAMLDRIRALIPGVGSDDDASVSMLHAATCMYSTTPDHDFVIAEHPRHPRVAGRLRLLRPRLQCSSPVVGEILADLVLDGSHATRSASSTRPGPHWPADCRGGHRMTADMSLTPETTTVTTTVDTLVSTLPGSSYTDPAVFRACRPTGSSAGGGCVPSVSPMSPRPAGSPPSRSAGRASSSVRGARSGAAGFPQRVPSPRRPGVHRGVRCRASEPAVPIPRLDLRTRRCARRRSQPVEPRRHRPDALRIDPRRVAGMAGIPVDLSRRQSSVVRGQP